MASDADWFIYKYEGTDPDDWTNAAVRLAQTLQRPLIYLYGVTPGRYEPIFQPPPAPLPQLVVGAYRERCSVCRLHHVELLDAAHILPDRDERGRPEVPNGLALCKIHHAAFDTNILGISPSHVIAIRSDVLEEVDGPMLRHGLQEMNGKSNHVPTSSRLKPNPDYLAERFERFGAA